MKARTGREMRKLMLAVSAATLALVLATIAYFLIDVILTTNRNIERDKEIVIEQSVLALAEVGENISGMTGDTRMIGMFNQETIYDILGGNWEVFYDFIGDFAINFYPIEYIGVIRGDKLVSYRALKGVEIDPEAMPTSGPSEQYQVLNRFGDREGTFISFFYPIDLSMIGLEEFRVNMVSDRTAEMAAVESYFKDQRNNLIARLAVVSAIAVALSLLITTLVLRFFTHKYVARPIEQLNRAAEEIAAGTYTGEVRVDESSAYAALQGLLRSGQKVLRRMDQEMG